MKTRTMFAAALACALALTNAQAQTVESRVCADIRERLPLRRHRFSALRRAGFPARRSGLPVGFAGGGIDALHLAQRDTLGFKDGEVSLFIYISPKDKAGMSTPNITTVYAFSFWNLKDQGPLVVEAPVGATAGGVLDIWHSDPSPISGCWGPRREAGPNS